MKKAAPQVVWHPLRSSSPSYLPKTSTTSTTVKVKKMFLTTATALYPAFEWSTITVFSVQKFNGVLCGAHEKTSKFVKWEPIKNHNSLVPIEKRYKCAVVDSDRNGFYKKYYYSDGSQIWMRE
jgi:hypothetical protein